MKFKPYQKNRIFGGVQYIFKFENGYGASVVSHIYSYGGVIGLWELAVIKFDDSGEWEIVYDTNITDDVIGYLTWEEVEEILDKIQKLKKE